MYNGGKNGSGVYQAIINQIPAHKKYIELFLGSGAVMRNKKKADINIGVDLNSDIIGMFKFPEWMNFYNMGWHKYLDLTDFYVNEYVPYEDIFIYADPPYLEKTRNSNRPLYKHEFKTEAEHIKLLEYLNDLSPVMIMISSYRNSLYDNLLEGWRIFEFNAYDRQNRLRKECLYCNYPEPDKLHDYSYLGENFTERQRIKRKIKRHADKLRSLPALERNAILEALNCSAG